MTQTPKSKVRNRRNRKKGDKVKTNYRNYLATKRKADLKRDHLKHTKGLLPAPTHCDTCGAGTVEYTTYALWPDTAERAKWAKWRDDRLYGCTSCGARVGVHARTDHPLGYMADAATRAARRSCKPVFIEATQVVFHGNKGKAYAWLAKAMQLPSSKAHWGMFDITQCHQARELTLTLLFDEDSYI